MSEHSRLSENAGLVPVLRAPVLERQHRLAVTAKRCIDLVIAIAALVVTAPLLLALCAMIYAQDGKSPIFRQKRRGHLGRVFECYKLRTMVPDADRRLDALLNSSREAAAEWQQDHKLRNDPRVTALGRFLRKTSLDELPQLVNVLRGEMSIVGPRPIVDREIEKYGMWFRYYAMARPGITGLWQVCGRNDIGYGKRVALDVKYVREWSLAGDLVILLRTIPYVFSGRGAY